MISHGAEMLTQAAETIKQRQSVYGPPDKNFEVIADRWNAHLKGRGYTLRDNNGAPVLLDSADVAHMSADIKMARSSQTMDHEDSWLDLAGYAACGLQIVKRRKAVQIAAPGFIRHGQVWEGEPVVGALPADLKAGDLLLLNYGEEVEINSYNNGFYEDKFGRGWNTSVVAYRRVASAK